MRLTIASEPLRFRLSAIFLAAAMVSLALTGCSTPNYTPTTSYALTPKSTPVKAESTGKTLAVRTLDAARPYGQPIVCRDSGHVLNQLPHSEWAELPRDTVTRALLDALVAAHHYSDVGPALDMTRPDFILTGQLRKFDLVRTSNPWTADCEVRLEVREAVGTVLVYADTLTASEPLAKNDVSALPQAMSKAVSRVVDAAVAGILSK